MAKSVNYESKDIRTKDGNLKFGHIHDDQTKSSIMLQGQGGLEYITIDQEGATGKYITNRCRGRYQVIAGDAIEKGQPGMWFDAKNSDIIIRTGGRLKLIGENIDLIATGGGNDTGVISLKATEKIKFESKQVDLNGTETCNIFTDGNIQLTANNILKMYGGTMEKLTGAGEKLLNTTAFNTSIKK